MQRITFLAAVVLAIAVASACGKASTSPSDASGVTVNGSLVAPSASQGVQVAVAGTSVTARVSAAGQFALLNVPPGDADLRFTGPGVNASLGLSDLRRGETVSISVSLAGTSALLESRRSSGGSEEQLEGRVESLPPATPAGSFVAAGRSVTTNDATRFFLHDAPASFSSLALGQRVFVKGQVSGSALLASVVTILNTNTGTGEEFELRAVITAKSGAAPNLTLTIGTHTVITTSETEVKRNGDAQGVDALQIGLTVEVSGRLLPDGRVSARAIHIVVDAVSELFVAEGSVGGRSGSCPTISFSVNGHLITTDASTVFTPSCAAIDSSSRVLVKGVVQPNLPVKATSVKKL